MRAACSAVMRATSLLAVLVLMSRASIARAEPAPPASASASESAPASPASADIKKRGDDAMDSGRPADALAAYVEAYGLTKDPALLYNKGRALQALGEVPQALEELLAFDRGAPAREADRRSARAGHDCVDRVRHDGGEGALS
jgi:tetratricopeptide (TPR) repeat protein